jgi:hypothetical protein
LFRLSWDNCDPLVTHRVIEAGTQVSLLASVTGHDQAHQGYEVWIQMRSSVPEGLADAWRFDSGGCQATPPLPIPIDHLPPGFVSKTCPSFQGFVPSVQLKVFDFDASTHRARVVLSNAYPLGIATPNPATRYFLMRVLFDHTRSVVGPGTPGLTCGSFERTVRFIVTKAEWLDMGGTEHPWPLETAEVTAVGTMPVPALRSTWGQIKSQYRM